MSTEQITTEQPTKVAKKPTLSAKYSKFMVYGYWLANQLLSSNHIDDNTYNAILKHQLMFGDVDGQTEYFENFFEEQKASAKTMKQDIRKHNKPPKAKKEKVSDPDAPKAKRGRKKKVVEDSSTPEEKMVQEIIDAAEAMTIVEAAPEKMEIVETAPEPVETAEPLIFVEETVRYLTLLTLLRLNSSELPLYARLNWLSLSLSVILTPASPDSNLATPFI